MTGPRLARKLTLEPRRNAPVPRKPDSQVRTLLLVSGRAEIPRRKNFQPSSMYNQARRKRCYQENLKFNQAQSIFHQETGADSKETEGNTKMGPFLVRTPMCKPRISTSHSRPFISDTLQAPSMIYTSIISIIFNLYLGISLQ